MAGKQSTAFFCNECGYESSKWMGQCPGCRQWNTMVEAPVKRVARSAARSSQGPLSGGRSQPVQKPVPLSQVELEDHKRILTHMKELDRVLGGGIVQGSLVLVGGDPGIGKSTLLLQMCRLLASDGMEILYISGEESLQQIKLRASRIGPVTDTLKLLCETNLQDIEAVIDRDRPGLVVIDSIQTMYHEEVASAPGSVSQVREATGVLLRLAKGLNIPIFIVGHVTKEGAVAGPRVLEHMVDSVLYFEGDGHASYRILRGVKNRFGSTNEIGVFEMRQDGLAQVENPSEYMLNGRPLGESGSVVVCSLEGTRPMLIEVQALVTPTGFGMPRRQSTGADLTRVNLLMAVLEKRAGLGLGDHDAYINVAGGMRMQEPALDLGIVMAVVSSFRNVPFDEGCVVFGEVGLSGEVRSVSMAEHRISEAKKLGFESCILPKASLEALKTSGSLPKGIKLYGVSNIREAIDSLRR